MEDSSGRAVLQQTEEVTKVILKVIYAMSFGGTSASLVASRASRRDDEKCELIGTFSLITQAFLGLLCLSSLIAKRFYEYPVRRTWQVWFFDVLKQVIGALGVHVFNVLLSIIKSNKPLWAFIVLSSREGEGNFDDGSGDDPCDWYFLNIIFDCTIGVFVFYLVFNGMNRVCREVFHITQIDSGNYGPDHNKPSARAYLKQLAVYFGSLMITKVILYGFVECFETQLLWITSHVILVWLDDYPDEFEIFVVMFIVPVIMNCLQLILVDNIIQSQLIRKLNTLDHQRIPESNASHTAAMESTVIPRESPDSISLDQDPVSNGKKVNGYGTFDFSNP